MSYAVKEIYYTLQGEGVHAGRGAVFLRFAGCNLWSGREEDRETAVCSFCDTEFVGLDGENGGKYKTAAELADAVATVWASGNDGSADPFVVCTGGEPMLQLDEALVESFHQSGFFVAIETNGTIPVPGTVDWICVSPKEGADLVQVSGDELKLVYPQGKLEPVQFESLKFEYFSLQPLEDAELQRNTALALDYCLNHPRWRLSLQLHKLLSIR